MTHCIACGWLLDSDHLYNVHCPVANAEAEQVEAEARAAQRQPLTDEDRALIDRCKEQVFETLAYARFVRMVTRP